MLLYEEEYRTASGLLPYLPLRWTARLAALHRFGPLGLGISAQYGGFLDDLGHGAIAGARVEYRPSRVFKAWLAGNVERDVDATGAPLYTGWGGIGARLRF